MSPHALSRSAIINNYLALPYYAHYMPATAPKMKLQKDEVVVVECSEQISTCGIQEKKAVRDTARVKWVGKHGRQIRHIGIQLHLATLASRPG